MTDHQSNKLATVKVYDKTLDLMGREGCKTVGSRFPVILGSKRARGAMERRVWKAQSAAMTRIELSLHLDSRSGCDWDLDDMINAWHEKIPGVLDLIADGVLNHETVLRGCYEKLSLHALLGQLGKVAPNFLVIGTERSWLVNCRTGHANFFVGTESKVCLRKNIHSKQTWARIEQLVKRYAFPGAKVFIFYLGRHCFNDFAAAVTWKPRGAPYQPPGCGLSCNNGILTPPVVQAPIDPDVLERLELTSWQVVKKAVVKVVQSDRPLDVDGSESVAGRI